jgi:hypothetical protein
MADGDTACHATGTGRKCHGHFEQGTVRIHYEEAGSGFPLRSFPATD